MVLQSFPSLLHRYGNASAYVRSPGIERNILLVPQETKDLQPKWPSIHTEIYWFYRVFPLFCVSMETRRRISGALISSKCTYIDWKVNLSSVL